ncbi:MAG TPA: EVE domain-containing protein [Phycisphaerales bacterium]|nr:EVE domain-containing protein [Phycisphaerales bacterium]
MATFLFKTEPDEYGWDDLVREKRAVWTGVTSPAAQKHLRAVRKGDEILLYHTGDQRRIVGLARAVKGAYADPQNPALTASGESKATLVDIAPVRAAAKTDATLAAIKADARFAEFALVRQGRLSVMPVPAALDKRLRELAGL